MSGEENPSARLRLGSSTIRHFGSTHEYFLRKGTKSAALSFSATLDFDGRELALKFDGPIEGDSYGADVDIEGLGEYPLAMTRVAGSEVQAADEPMAAPDMVLKAVENWGRLPSHVRAAIEGLVTGELKDWEDSKDED